MTTNAAGPLTDKVTRKFERLLEEGKETLRKAGWNGSKYTSTWPDSVEYRTFRTEALNLCRIVCGESSDHYRELRRLAESERSEGNPHFFKDVWGVLRAAHRDFTDGLLFDIRAVIAAEVLGDFIDQADALLAGGHRVAAVSIASAVLEDSMRRLCAANDITVPDKTTLNWLNTELARKGVYEQLVAKRITALADVRNLADHGHFDKVSEEDARDLVKYVRRFCADHLAPKP